MTVAHAVSTFETMIQMICDPASSRFDKPYHDGTGLYISDGRILLSFGDVRPPEGVPCVFKIDGEWVIGEKHRKPPDGSAEFIAGVGDGTLDVPTVGGPPKGANLLWEKMEECGPCGGDGYQECDMGHDHDCDDCDGKGEFLQDCDEAKEDVEILGHCFARRYVWAIGQLPGVKMCPEVRNEMLCFTFEGGKGVLMAVMKDHRR